jgi:predicted heme/steroid binding protein
MEQELKYSLEALPVYDPQELMLRDGVKSKEVWIAYKGLVYDVSTSPLFQGGKHYRHRCGVDLTTEMAKAPHLDDVMKKFSVVGRMSV